jgi:hypothetical protein
MANFFRGVLAVLAGLLAILFLWIGVAEGLKGDYRILAGGLIYTAWFGFTSWSALRRIGDAKKKLREDLAAISSALEAMPYDQAVSIAREKNVPIPNELALRKVRPTAEEWVAFEWKTVQFLVERVGATAHTKVTFIP